MIRTALQFVSAGTVDRYRPLLANLIVIRRCNLSCGYCTEYDDKSPPIPLAVLEDRLDHLARLRCIVVAITGGESLLHPQLAEVVRGVRARGMTPSVNTNGFLLTEQWIDDLNGAGLDTMQVSVDGVVPNSTTQKSLKTLLPKLQLLAARAKFRVRINTVLGTAPAEEAIEVVKTVVALGLEAKCSLLRNHDGTLAKVSDETRAVYEEISKIDDRQPWLFGESFQKDLLRDGAIEWKCRAGGRFFHVNEFGNVDLCAPKTGTPSKPLAEYTEDDLRFAFDAPKPCVSRCPVAYAHQLSRFDAYRGQDGDAYPGLAAPSKPGSRSLPVLG